MNQLLGLALTLITSSVVAQTTVVLPAGLEGVEGDEALAPPFTAPFMSTRSQSLYDTSSITRPTMISQIAYRLDGGSSMSGVDFVISEIQVNLSTFTGSALSPTFADNVGSHETVAFTRGALPVVLSSGSSPNTYDLVIDLGHPFPFDSADGNLLVDVMKFSGEFDFANFDAATTSNITTAISDHVSDATARSTHNDVLVAEFTLVPEPKVVPVALLGSLTRLMFRRRVH